LKYEVILIFLSVILFKWVEPTSHHGYSVVNIILNLWHLRGQIKCVAIVYAMYVSQ
jgi:hypothetical protein